MKQSKLNENLTTYVKCINTLVKELKYTKKQAIEIMNIIENNTNNEYGRDMYRDYRDEIDEKYIDEFIKENRNKYTNLEEAKNEFIYFIEEKYDFFDESRRYYEDELAKEINSLDFVKDSGEIIRTLQDFNGILYLNYDIFDLLKKDFKIAISFDYDISFFSNTAYNGDYESCKEEFLKYQNEEDNILQKLCKVNGFDLSQVFDYMVSENGTYENEKGIKLRKENQFFEDLYKEFINAFGYGENLRFLTYMNIDEILNFCVKDSEFNLGRCGSFGLYAYWPGSGSLFEINNHKDLNIKTSELGLNLFNCTNIDSVYGFTNQVFEAY